VIRNDIPQDVGYVIPGKCKKYGANKMIDERQINTVESIAESLKIVAEKPPVGVTLEITDGFNKASENLRELVLADARNKKVQKYCEHCGVPLIVDQDEEHPLCEEHSGAGL
jgi:hypothetical protein